MLRKYRATDLQNITNILNYYVKNDACIFQMEPYSFKEIEDKFNHIATIYPVFVVEDKGKVIAFAYGARWRDKPAYDNSVEVTIYVHPNYKKLGIGKVLYKKLIDTLNQMGFHLLVAGMTMPNLGSQKLHESFGFEKVGEFKDAGMKFGQWHNVGFWQKLLINSKKSNKNQQINE